MIHQLHLVLVKTNRNLKSPSQNIIPISIGAKLRSIKVCAFGKNMCQMKLSGEVYKVIAHFTEVLNGTVHGKMP